MAVPIVLVHGIRISGASMGRIAAAVPDRVVAHPDLPGHGERRGERFTLDGAVDAVTAAVESLGGRAVLCGLSLGGFVTMAAAARRPGLAAGLVVFGSTTRPTPLSALPFRLLARGSRHLPDGGAAMSGALARRVLGARAAADMAAGGLAMEAVGDVVTEVARFDALGALPRYPGPVWFVNGARDHFRADEERFRRACRDARLLSVPRGGHLFPLVRPETAARLLRDAALTVDALDAQAAAAGAADPAAA